MKKKNVLQPQQVAALATHKSFIEWDDDNLREIICWNSKNIVKQIKS